MTQLVKFPLKILASVFLVLALVCGVIGFWSGCGVRETIESTLFVLLAIFILIVIPISWLCSRRPWTGNLRPLLTQLGVFRFYWLRNLRQTPLFSDPQLGELRFSFGFETCLWRGLITLSPGKTIRLAVVGTADGPNPEALSIAKSLAAQFPTRQANFEKELFEHYKVYSEVIAQGKLKHPIDPLPAIEKPSDIWSHISWVNASVILLNGNLLTELSFTVPWDNEHTLGARFEAGEFIELNGSVIEL